uniref:Pseudouridylate synthase RPUSD4, mitochondrial n=1 Tax=Onchocerca volvulus TaxID=6282 RepID=A0A8R1TZR1_ONCVO
MVYKMDEKDDFFGIEKATEIPLPHHMKAAIMSRSRTTVKKYCEASNKRSAVSDQSLSTTVDTSGIDYLDSLYFGDFGDIEIDREESSEVANVAPDTSGIDYVDALYFGDFLNSRSALNENKSYNNFEKSLFERTNKSNRDNIQIHMKLAQRPLDRSPNESVGDFKEDIGCGDNENDADDDNIQSFEILNLKTYKDMGLSKIWEEIQPVWKMNDEDLVNLMINRIIYEDEELIAFDKPYQMACSNAPSNQAELLRILPKLSSRVAPHIDCLRMIKSIAKPVTGVILFAKNQSTHEKIKALYDNRLLEQCYRVITNMAPAHQEAVVNIPLVKCRRKNNNFMMLPLGVNKSSEINPFLEASTYYRVLKHDSRNHTSYMECIVNRDVPEQIRAHLGIGLVCPIIGDMKYNCSRREAGRGIPPRLSDIALQDLNIIGNSFRRLPMYIHLKEVIIPVSKRNQEKIHICAPIPSFFTYTLKKLRLFKK